MEGRRIYVKHSSYTTNELKHYGTPDMKWGQRLYQNKDGSLTALGRIHYGIGQARVKRAEKVNERLKIAAEKAENESQAIAEREKKRYQNGDGTLNLRGQIHYRTTDKYKLLSDDDIRQQTSRLQLQKNLEELKKQTSSVYRLKNKFSGVVEDVTVAGFRKGAEKLVNNLVDTSVSKILNTDKEDVTRARELAQKLADMPTKEMEAFNKRTKFEKELTERITGKPLPADYQYSDLTESEKNGIKNSSINKSEEKSSDNKHEEKQKMPESKPKPEEQKSSEKKPEVDQSSKPKSEEQKASENKPEEKQKTPEQKPEKKKENVNESPSKSDSQKTENVKVKREPVETSKERAQRAYGDHAGRIRGLYSSGMTIQQIADKLNCSTSTVEKYLKGDK